MPLAILAFFLGLAIGAVVALFAALDYAADTAAALQARLDAEQARRVAAEQAIVVVPYATPDAPDVLDRARLKRDGHITGTEVYSVN